MKAEVCGHSRLVLADTGRFLSVSRGMWDGHTASLFLQPRFGSYFVSMKVISLVSVAAVSPSSILPQACLISGSVYLSLATVAGMKVLISYPSSTAYIGKITCHPFRQASRFSDVQVCYIPSLLYLIFPLLLFAIPATSSFYPFSRHIVLWNHKYDLLSHCWNVLESGTLRRLGWCREAESTRVGSQPARTTSRTSRRDIYANTNYKTSSWWRVFELSWAMMKVFRTLWIVKFVVTSLGAEL